MVTQRQSVSYGGTFDLLKHMLVQLAKDVKVRDGKSRGQRIIQVFGVIEVIYEPKLVTLEWIASPTNDMYADAALTAILQADAIDHHPGEFPAEPDSNEEHFKECVVDTLQDMFGKDCVPKTFKGDSLSVVVDNKTALIDFKTLVC